MAEFVTILKKHSAKFILLATTVVLIYWVWIVPPKYQGYQPDQPVPFSHKIHAGEMNMDCRFCHASVEKGPHASVPDTATCMKCHQQVASDSPYIQYVRQSYEQGVPIRWIKAHDLPDHARFSHKPHIAFLGGQPGVENTAETCAHCHGDMREVEGKVAVASEFNMGWCVNCHRSYENQVQDTPAGFNQASNLTTCGTCHY